MTQDKFCNIHGPYPAYMAQCPYCAGQVPQGMPNLGNSDDVETNIPGRGGGYAQPAPAWGDAGEAPTQPPVGRGGGAPAFDPGEDETAYGRAREQVEETEIDLKPGEMPPMAILWVKEGRRRGKIYNLSDDTIIGNARNTNVALGLDDPKVSKLHARVRFRKDHFEIMDLGSTNGTQVNGETIAAVIPLKENDLIKIGSAVFVVKILE